METVIDWSKAPEGATHYQKSSDGFELRWLDMNSGEFGSVWYQGEWKFRYIDYKDMGAIYVARPEPAWTGEGLPPVGTVCEYLGAHQYNEWSEVKIFGAWRNFVFVDFTDGWRQEDNPQRFRPIRTPEQIAADDRDKAVEQMTEESLHGHYAFTKAQAKIACRALYDAGYRKQVQP